MPDLDGYDLYMEVRERYRQTPVILMTAYFYDKDHVIKRSRLEGLQEVIFKKPVDPARLKQIILQRCRPESSLRNHPTCPGREVTLAGYATLEGTAAYRQRFARTCAAGHFRSSAELWLSSIGLGTYLGDADERTDALYAAAITRAVEMGCNVLDTAINYRHQRSERVIGRVLATHIR